MFVLEGGETSGEGTSSIYYSAPLDTNASRRSIALSTKRTNRPTGTVDEWHCCGP